MVVVSLVDDEYAQRIMEDSVVVEKEMNWIEKK